MKSWGLMNKKRFTFFNKGFLINQLMQLYSLILVVVLMIIMVGLSLFMFVTNFKDAEKTIDNVTTEIATSLKSKDSDMVSSILAEVAASPSHYENMYNFLTMSQQDYFEYMINLWHETGVSTYFPDIIKTVFINYQDVESIDIVFDSLDYYLHADTSSVMGKKIDGPYKKPKDALTSVRPLTNPSTSEVKGAIYVTFTKESLTSFFNEDNQSKDQVGNFIFNSRGELMFENHEEISDKSLNKIKENMLESGWVSPEDLDNRYFVRNKQVRDKSLVTILDKREVRWLSILQILPIFLIGFSVIILLLVFLNKVFEKYSNQMSRIVHVTNQVSQGNLEAQVDTIGMELELGDLASAINQMVINLNQYIEDIYALEIKQRDAHMRALQSQINPHFLYNTLEYIRMYAISQKQDELADVVYAFSALLRNNMTQEKTTTLKDELDFCEKYVYLYQMRYPDSIAYNFTMDNGLEDFVVPKFIIQPLVENYFVHGIDYERQDNAISVKAMKQDGLIEIRVIDNGLGMEKERLEEVNLELSQKGFSIQNSIGIINVYERIKGYFGEDSKMWVESVIEKGVTIVIQIKE
ncbi:sensor histidine kinase [Vagococcus fluvialis]|uniref:Sensor histidine kinase n=1 Tax=Vagococcus fluvialis TaxID=2738 RepID=A0A7X6DAG0_9ENTE|nr:sensor histidine kinase [Vagococcus fluvialis]NKC68749.1 sensor histidine kinase [Vagococcus fluvialis]